MSYGWLLVIIVIAGAALYSMGILSPSTYMKKGCVGFERLHYKDHIFRASPGDRGLWTVWSSDTERESVFQLRQQNGAGQTLRLRAVDAEYPVGVHVTWSERGYDCDYYNTAGDTDSGCQEQNVSEAEVTTLSMEDVGRGTLDLRHGTVYRMKVKVTFDAFNALSDHSEVAVCSGKIEGGAASSSGSGTGSGSGSGTGSGTGTGTGSGTGAGGFCMLMYSPTTSDYEVFYTTRTGGSWSGSTALTDNAVNDARPSVSCTGSSFCAAAWQTGSHPYDITSVTWDGNSWTSAGTVSGSGSNIQASVSCPTDQFCGCAWNNENNNAQTSRWTGSGWSSPDTRTTSGQYPSISCSSTSNCIAVWKTGAVVQYSLWNGASWSASATLHTASGAETAGPEVSCPTDGFCMAVWVHRTSGNDYEVTYATWGGSSWSTPAGFTGDTTERYAPSVSCPTASVCMVVWYTDMGDPRIDAASWNGSAWSAVSRLSPDDGANPSVSCPSSTSCTAVWRASGACGQATWDGNDWSTASTISGTGSCWYPSVSCVD